ncbi:MAG: phosphopyruvate hydratase [Rhodobacteraceae bacterium]|nr:phosphopyruvate hydratase [Paracoccaceae bacterium]
MNSDAIVELASREIFDSRGNPTVEVDALLSDGSFGRAAVPSGASTGVREAVELRDEDGSRLGGKGVRIARDNVLTVIAPAVRGQRATDQRAVDGILCALDESDNKRTVGANAILGVSLAVAKAAAAHRQQPLFRYLGGRGGPLLPVPLLNVINGGCHADNGLDIQEFMIVLSGFSSFTDALVAGAEVFHALKSGLSASGLSTAVGDEGGFAPDMKSTFAALKCVESAIERAGFSAGEQIGLALDCAASEYFCNGSYEFAGEGLVRSIGENVEHLVALARDFPIVSIEDGCSEDDWDGWRLLTEAMGNRCQLVGDDLFVTNCEILRAGIERRCANALLVKPNQIGTLTETIEAVNLAHAHGYATVMSHRSGETEDTTISDLSVALRCGQIKAGSMSRSDRVAKYNQLLRIEEEIGSSARFAGPALNASWKSRGS